MDETALRAAMARGDLVDLTPPAGADPWAHEVPAAVIRAALLGGDGPKPDPRGIRLRGAFVTGPLELDNVHAEVPLVLQNCRIDEGISLCNASLPTLSLDGSLIASVDLSAAHFTGAVTIATAHVLGDLRATQLQADGGLFADHRGGSGLIVDGELSLLGARIGGQLNLRGAIMSSLDADRLTLTGSALLTTSADGTQPFTANGPVSLIGANIGGQLNLSGAQLTAGDSDGDCLIADSIVVGSDVFLSTDDSHPFSAAGGLRLVAAKIAGLLRIELTELPTAHDYSPTAPGIRPYCPARVRLDAASAGTFELGSRPSSMSAASTFNLDGFSYTGRPASGFGLDSVAEWLCLLDEHTPSFAPQPYQQLAAAYRAAGLEGQAKKILIAAQNQRRDRLLRPNPATTGRERSRLWFARVGLKVQELTIGYGYRTWPLFLATVVLAGLAAILGIIAGHTHTTSSADFAAHRPATSSSPAQPCSSAEQVGVGLSTGIPFLSTVTKGDCTFDTTTTIGGGLAAADWAVQALAWATGTLAIAGYTGIVGKS